MKLAVIGSGPIVPFHLDALKRVGFTISAICSRPGSLTTHSLAKRYGSQAYAHFSEIPSENYDAVLIACAAETLIEPLIYFIKQNIPILVEKPVTPDLESFQALGDLHNPKIMVGFNRRFYSSVQKLKTLLNDSRSNSFFGIIPENSWNSEMDKSARKKFLTQNTVHVFDLVRYLSSPKEINIINHRSHTNKDQKSIDISLESDSCCGILHVTFGAPGSYRLEFSGDGISHVLQPFEILRTYDSIDVLEPDQETPIRRYIPKLSLNQFEIEKHDIDFKPGFLNQSMDFAALLQGKNSSTAATLKDAYESIKICREIAVRLEW